LAKNKPFINIGPGDIIRDEIEARGWSQETFAEILGISLTHVSRMINNKEAISFERARLLSGAFGNTPQFWINAYTNYRLRQEKGKNENKVAVKAAINSHMPLADMVSKRWIQPYGKNLSKLIEQVKLFWTITHINFSFMDKMVTNVHFRKTVRETYNAYYSLTWLHMARKCAAYYRAGKYQKESLEQLAKNIPRFTVKRNGIRDFIRALSSSGIKFFVLQHLKKTYMDGASFYDEDTGNPVIVYTKRYDRVDNFWFTITHEIAHILKHLAKNKKRSFIDCLDESSHDAIEKEANRLAAGYLRHDEILREVRFKGYYPSRALILRAERELGIHKSIIVGTLQYHKKLSYQSLLSSEKDKLENKIPAEYYTEYYFRKKQKGS